MAADMINEKTPGSPYEIIGAAEAAGELGLDPTTLRDVIEQGTFPFPLGYWIEHGTRRSFGIYRGLLDQAKARIEGRRLYNDGLG